MNWNHGSSSLVMAYVCLHCCVSSLQGALYRVPYGFFNQPKLYMEEMFKEIGGDNDCELRALRGWCS